MPHIAVAANGSNGHCAPIPINRLLLLSLITIKVSNLTHGETAFNGRLQGDARYYSLKILLVPLSHVTIIICYSTRFATSSANLAGCCIFLCRLDYIFIWACQMSGISGGFALLLADSLWTFPVFTSSNLGAWLLIAQSLHSQAVTFTVSGRVVAAWL